jgi:acyl carrier protein
VTATRSTPGTWEIFVSSVAEIAGVDPGDIREDTRLINDLGLDSVALTEIVVVLVDDFDVPELSHELDEGAWAEVSVGELFRTHFGPPG